jgi:ribulose-5-phosphate 4-epimerase/fuculose-1-phosphate aldolase
MAGFEAKPRTSSRPLGCSEAEWLARVDLAACYRLADIHGMSKVIWNHITARVPDEPDNLLVFRFGCRYDEVTASNLVKMSLDGRLLSEDAGDLNTAAAVIHSGFYRARPDIMCVMHCHTRAGQGVAALKDGLLLLTQESMLLHDDVAYHAYEGISDDEAECDRLASDLGPKHQMIMRNHGLITVGKSVGEAFWRMFHLDMACKVQMDVLATGRDFIQQPPAICAKVRQQYLADFFPGLHEWPALLRKLDKIVPDYAT